MIHLKVSCPSKISISKQKSHILNTFCLFRQTDSNYGEDLQLIMNDIKYFDYTMLIGLSFRKPKNTYQSEQNMYLNSLAICNLICSQ